MRRKSKIPSYTLHKRTGQARVRLNGVDHYLGLYDTDASRAKYAELVKRHAAAKAKADAEESLKLFCDVTIVELVPVYLAHCETYYRKRSKATSQVLLIKLALRVLREKYAGLEATEFSVAALEACRDAFVAQGLCRKECNRRTQLVRQFFRWAGRRHPALESLWGRLGVVEPLKIDRTEAPEHDPIGPVDDDVL